MKTSIYHTVDNVPVTGSVEKIINLILSKPESKWAALIDTAFDHGEHGRRPDFGEFINCYDFPELRGLASVAPYLVALNPGSELRTKVTRLIRHCQGRPMLSFVGTTENLSGINAHWRSVHKVRVVDEQEMLLRFADTRTLSYLPKVLISAQWAAVCGALSSWAYFDRAGRLVTCNIPEFIDRVERISITSNQLEQLVRESHPDVLMTLIAESMGDIVPTDHPASERYEMIKESCRLSRKHGVDNNADVLALAVAAYLTKGESNVDQRLEALLRRRSWSEGTLGDAIVDAEIV